MHIATICTLSYVPRLRVLATSFREQVPDGRVSALVLDALPGDLTDPLIEALVAEDVVDEGEFARLATAYDLVELATALKPALLQHLLRVSEAVHYVDPDVQFHADPRFLDDLAREWGLVLTPHLTTPPSRPGGGSTGPEDIILAAGVYNLGYLGVGRAAADDFLPWWKDRLARECRIDVGRSRFVDQRWMDLVPGYFRHHIVTHAGVNVAWWNMPRRPISRDADRWIVCGQPLVFLHASGVDPHARGEISRHQDAADPFRPPLDAPVHVLLDHYRAAVLAAGHDAYPPPEPGLGRIRGLHITPTERRRYLSALVQHEAGRGAEPPNPFTHGPDAFTEWVDQGAPDDEAIPSPGGRRSHGVNLVGHLSAPTGVGRIARLMATALAARGIPCSTYDLDGARAAAAPGWVQWEEVSHGLFDTTLVCANADEALDVNHRLHPDLRGCTRIGLWWWETEEFPERFSDAFGVVDEVWTGSGFSQRAIGSGTLTPVRRVPIPIVVTPDPPDDIRSRLGISDEAFLVGAIISLDSVAERKNPLGIINAYRRAFGVGAGTALVLKMSGNDVSGVIDRVRYAASGRPDIHVITQTWSIEDTHGLLAASDCVLSLHRSEGFGLALAEAMAYARPVIATAYGGNLEFMDDDSAFLVPWTAAPISRAAHPYAVGGAWADPDLDAAAEALRRVRMDPAEANRRATKGREIIAHAYSLERAGAAIAALLDGDEEAQPVSRGVGSSAPAGPIAFYHSVAVPNGPRFEGDWSLVDVDAYLGHLPIRGWRVLDAGTATGAVAFAAEARGAREVIALDLPLDVEYDARLPVSTAQRREALQWRRAVRQGFHTCKDALGSSVRLVTGDLRDLRSDLGRFDLAVLGNVLQHLRDPAGALLAVAGMCNVIVVTETDWMHGEVPDDLPALVTFGTDQPYSWYQARPGWVSDILARHGFEDLRVSHHAQRFNGRPSSTTGERPAPAEIPHFTVVGWHRDVPRDARISLPGTTRPARSGNAPDEGITAPER